MSYRSKDSASMNLIRHALYAGMPDASADEHKKAWDYVRKQITIDDLHTFAVTSFRDHVVFPRTGFNPVVVVVFPHVPSDEDLKALYQMFERQGLAPQDIYATSFYKKNDPFPDQIPILETILKSEIRILAPSLVLSFGHDLGQSFGHPHHVHSIEDVHYMTTFDIQSVLLAPDDPATPLRKQQIWTDVRHLMQYYKL